MTKGVFATVARGLRLPAGWGFPPAVTRSNSHPSSQPDAKILRAILFPSEEDEMLAQLVRWHYAILRSRPHVWRSLALPNESYDPCGVFKHVIEGDIFKPCSDPSSGYLMVDYNHRGETRGLIGALRRTTENTATLTFPGWSGTVPMQVSENPQVWQVMWPEWMATKTAFVIPEDKVTSNLLVTFRLRPLSFDAAGMVRSIAETSTIALQKAGVLDSFFSAVKILDKLAVAWLALAILEDEWDQLSLEGNDA
jgi:hypothetical protein